MAWVEQGKIGAGAPAAAAPVTVTVNTALNRADHGNRFVLMDSSSSRTFTMTSDAVGGWQDGDYVIIGRAGTGAVSVNQSGATVNRASYYQASLRVRYARAVLTRVGPNTWWMDGELSL